MPAHVPARLPPTALLPHAAHHAAGALPGDFTGLQPEVRIRSPGLARAFFELFLGERDLVPGARPVWAAGSKGLLESEIVKREARNG